MEQAAREMFSGIPLYITNDVEVGWAGSRDLEPGINIVAGTGSIAFGTERVISKPLPHCPICGSNKEVKKK